MSTYQLISAYPIPVLVGGVEYVLFFLTLGISSSHLTNLCFSDGQVYHQPEYQLYHTSLEETNLPVLALHVEKPQGKTSSSPRNGEEQAGGPVTKKKWPSCGEESVGPGKPWEVRHN